jgi:hypothetical protein
MALMKECMTMKFKKLIKTGLLAGALVSPLMFAGNAEASGYCREYQKSIYVGGDRESGYGTACLQPDGSWMITDTRGSVDPFDELRQDNAIIYAQERPVYYRYGPSYRPVTYYVPVRQYYRPRPLLSFYFGDNDRHRHGWNHWNRGRDWDRHDRWDHDDGDRRRGHRHRDD